MLTTGKIPSRFLTVYSLSLGYALNPRSFSHTRVCVCICFCILSKTTPGRIEDDLTILVASMLFPIDYKARDKVVNVSLQPFRTRETVKNRLVPILYMENYSKIIEKKYKAGRLFCTYYFMGWQDYVDSLN
jgi:hypothetical protein